MRADLAIEDGRAIRRKTTELLAEWWALCERTPMLRLAPVK